MIAHAVVLATVALAPQPDDRAEFGVRPGHEAAAEIGAPLEGPALGRGRDLNGYGIEDVVVSRNVAATGGTLRAYACFIVAHKRRGGRCRS